MKEKKKASFLTPLAAVCMCIFFISVNLCTVKAAAGISVDTHSQQDIKKMYQQLDPQPQSTEYERKPGTKAPYSLGKVSDRTLQNGLNTLNFMRYVAAGATLRAGKREFHFCKALMRCNKVGCE